MSHIEYDEDTKNSGSVDIAKELKEARQLKATRDKILAAGRRKGIERRHVVVSFTLDELADCLGVSKRKLQRWQKAGKVDLADRAAVVELLRKGVASRERRARMSAVDKCPRCGKYASHGFTSEGPVGPDGLRCVPPTYLDRIAEDVIRDGPGTDLKRRGLERDGQDRR